MTRSKKEVKNKKTIIIISIVALVIILSLSAYLGYIYKYTLGWNNIIYSNVKVESIDLSAKTKEEAIELLKENYGDAILNKKLSVKAVDNNYEMDYSKLESKYNIEEVVEEAFDYGKDSTMLGKYKILKSNSGKEIDLDFTYDPTYIDEFIETVATEVNIAPTNAKLSMSSSGNFNVSQDKPGYEIDKEALKTDIVSNINGKVDEKVEIEAKVDEIKATVSAEELNKINSKIASFSTKYSHNSTNDRAVNVELATNAINGKVLMPGETFSYNDVVGKRTVEKGYRNAPVIVGNKVEDDLGGGICQVSSTLYQAVLRTGLKSVERYNHSLGTSYMPLGLDATVDFGSSLDYKFKNTFDSPIYIEGVTSKDRVLSFNIYGNSASTGRTYEIVSEAYETINAGVKNVEDPNLPEGQTVVEKNPINGTKVKVYRKIYENGVLIDTEFLSNDTYRSIDGIVRVGTKKP
ncbi:VanW family protein [Clostridium algidicarnis]|uniref:VanW family protein n=1 Tax=Clostridium algidicarnis TaxID=37659 RepID=UPI001C0E5660|nr:VanW family protein [Clostridium algidicarnis]MBU3196475.1 VanW family protein [Clostridium algidicarnis]